MKANVLLQSATKVVAESVFSSATFDFWASHINPTWSWQTPRARIIAREVAAKDSVTLILKPNRHVQPFIAGQHVSITVEIAGIRLTRSYSPSWIAGQEQLFSITVKRMHGGKVSQWLCDDSIIGQVVEIGAAFGEMTLAQPHPQRVFLAAGSGITPLMSMIRAATSVNSPDAIHLIYWVRRREELCFVAELDRLKADNPNLHVQFVLTQQDDLQSTERSGRINAAQIIDIVPDLGNSLVYACGPAGFVEQARQLTQAASGFYGEAFSLPLVLDTEASGDAHVNLELTVSKRSLRVPVGMPLLAALEAQGIRPASGCRMGLCNTCACIKQSGTTEHVLSRDRNDEAGTTVRICVSRACSDLSLAL
jgi:ferredoxin-NADP reductase